tara:strand:+ start:259 stop:540 length:282 start_codon:yes stop_codon:yes gene_type:complete
MSRLDDLRVLFNSFLNRRQTNMRQMKRVFQWRRYLDWKDLTYEEKLSAKRFLLIPVFAYLIIWIFNQNFFLIIMLLIGYIVYKKIEQGRIVKK